MMLLASALEFTKVREGLFMRKIKFGVILAGVVLTAALFIAADSNSDSLITKGYVDNVLMPQVEAMAGAGEKYAIVNISKGDIIVCDAGCEFIIRMGSGKIMATSKGGICDVTSGTDLANGSVAPSNHHLIVPLSDGRGMVANTDMIIMIKGKYEIQ